MLSFSATVQELRGNIAVGRDRLIAQSGLAPEALDLRRRLVAVLLVAPLIIAAASLVVLPSLAGPLALVGSLMVILAGSWLGALVVAQHGHEKLVGGLSLTAGAIIGAGVVGWSGGLVSPLALLLAGLWFEAWWTFRTKAALRVGVAAVAGAGFAAQLLSTASAASAWFWLPVALYGLTVALRISGQNIEAQTAEKPERIVREVEVTLAPDGEVAAVSSNCATLLGLEPEFIVNRTFLERLHVADRVAYMCALSDVRNGVESRSLELRLRQPKNGTDGAVVFQPVVAELYASGQDITVYLRDGGELANLRHQLAATVEEMEKLSVAKSSFLASVSHELRTPLNAIIGFSDMLVHELYGGFADPRQKEHVTVIRDAGNHLLGVVNSILDVSKLELGVYEISSEPFQFADAAAMCTSMIGPQATAKDITVNLEVQENVGEVVADRRAVQQMMINLLSNSVKFTPANGRVTLAARLKGDMVEISVRDTGIGISEADLDRLCRPFVQVGNDYARNYEGTGLGLALVKGLVELHRGSMVVHSSLGRGTSVTISLPRSGSATPSVTSISDLTGLTTRNEDTDGAYRKTA